MANEWRQRGIEKDISVGTLRVTADRIELDLAVPTHKLIFRTDDLKGFIGELREALGLSYDRTNEPRRTEETS